MSARSAAAWSIAAESLHLPVAPRVRPNPAQWLWYAFWGPLPSRHATWVLFDATSATWVLRHIARILAAAAPPVAVIAIFLPASPGLRALTAFVAGACAVLFTVTWINEATEHRLVQAGYDWGTGPRMRAKRDEVAQYLHNW